jgi:dephospho-CoA kinase
MDLLRQRRVIMALILGVTGSIATGKSHLCSYLCDVHNAVHADADKVVHRMYDPGKPGFDRIVAEFGEVIIGSDGYIDRKILGSQVFGDSERMTALTKAIGDIAGEMKSIIDKWREELPSDGIAVLEAVNLIEAGYSKWCDATWLVAVDNSVALPRLMNRNSFSLEEAQQRIDSQQPWEKRSPASDYVFHNNSELTTFEQSIDKQVNTTVKLFIADDLPKPRWFSWDKERQAT